MNDARGFWTRVTVPGQDIEPNQKENEMERAHLSDEHKAKISKAMKASAKVRAAAKARQLQLNGSRLLVPVAISQILPSIPTKDLMAELLRRSE
jgi:hypothetical protein